MWNTLTSLQELREGGRRRAAGGGSRARVAEGHGAEGRIQWALLLLFCGSNNISICGIKWIWPKNVTVSPQSGVTVNSSKLQILENWVEIKTPIPIFSYKRATPGSSASQSHVRSLMSSIDFHGLVLTVAPCHHTHTTTKKMTNGDRFNLTGFKPTCGSNTISTQSSLSSLLRILRILRIILLLLCNLLLLPSAVAMGKLSTWMVRPPAKLDSQPDTMGQCCMIR